MIQTEMFPVPSPTAKRDLAYVAVHAPHALRLAAQLFGVAPCPKCDFVWDHCACPKEQPK